VALGWPWVALCSPLSDFSFQHFSFSAFAQLWLCAALFPISAFSFQHFSFCRNVALGPPFLISAFSISAFQLLPKCGFSWLCPAFRCWKLDVGCSMFDVDDTTRPLQLPEGGLEDVWYHLKTVRSSAPLPAGRPGNAFCGNGCSAESTCSNNKSALLSTINS
jgi:hypothetical protein